ncbi:MAG: superoxide dismutase [Bifidobacteriaceae bacterium]|jgi:Fe-Mn family superoxide dismutase|nr:superoxide dismutase [Bifidobacteriaceae bacterium]
MALYTLPDLPYDYAALEPYISGRIMELHHDKHHAAYVAGLNTALEQLAQARDAGNFGTLPKLEKDLAFNLAGHVNHSVFWQNLTPDSPLAPSGELAEAIAVQFGSFEAFKAQFSAAATSIQGSGWAMLTWEPLAGQLLVNQLYDHQANLSAGLVPLLVLDMWEHAFYLDYLNVKADYVAAFWNIVNWEDVAARFARAKAQTPGLI